MGEEGLQGPRGQTGDYSFSGAKGEAGATGKHIYLFIHTHSRPGVNESKS